ncbi:MAG TPA: hypothetical protein VIV66_09365 [Pyrinomonadaceae bacterium]
MRIRYSIAVFIACTFLLVTIIYGCSPRGDGQDKSRAPSPTPTLQPTVSPAEMQLRKDAMRRTLEREAKWSNLESLEELSLKPLRSETRIWVGFDGAETPCFIVSIDGTQKSATLITARFDRRDGKVTVTPNRTELTAPRTGWSNFETYLKVQGITNPLKFSLDNSHIVDPDEGSIVIETKVDSSYSMVFFPLGTDTEDGKRALQICSRVEQEFGISMRCGERRS